MKRATAYLFLCLFILLYALAVEQSAVELFVSQNALRNASISLQIKNLTTGEVLASYNPNTVITPASTQKLWTTAAALELLGTDFRFSTYLETDAPIENGVLKGNLYIRGTGDPSLGSQVTENHSFMPAWIEAIREAGIKKIEGAIVADMSFFDGNTANPEWLWDDLGNYYAPGVFAINYLDNTTNIVLRSAEIGSVAEIVRVTPDIPEIQFENHILCTQITYDGAYVHGMPYNNCRYLTGSIPSNKGQFGVKGDIPNPGLLLAQHLTSNLQKANIQVNKSATYITECVKTTRNLIYEHQSAPLIDLITEINHQSNNMYAEALFRYLGSRITQPCTINNSAQVIVNCFANRGITLNTRFIKDGCGLASRDAVSAQLFVQLLQYMKKSNNYDAFYASLPISGQSGTLKGFLRTTALDGKVHAKSGTTSMVKSYAGYIEADNGDVLAFAIIVNNPEVKVRVVQTAIEKFLLNFYASYNH